MKKIVFILALLISSSIFAFGPVGQSYAYMYIAGKYMSKSTGQWTKVTNFPKNGATVTYTQINDDTPRQKTDEVTSSLLPKYLGLVDGNMMITNRDTNVTCKINVNNYSTGSVPTSSITYHHCVTVTSGTGTCGVAMIDSHTFWIYVPGPTPMVSRAGSC